MTAPTHKTISLSQPVGWEGRTIASVTVKKPKVKDLRAMQASLNGTADQLEQGIVMAATLTELPREVIEEMDTDDFTAVSEVIAGFFQKGPASETGAASLPKPPTG